MSKISDWTVGLRDAGCDDACIANLLYVLTLPAAQKFLGGVGLREFVEMAPDVEGTMAALDDFIEQNPDLFLGEEDEVTMNSAAVSEALCPDPADRTAGVQVQMKAIGTAFTREKLDRSVWHGEIEEADVKFVLSELEANMPPVPNAVLGNGVGAAADYCQRVLDEILDSTLSGEFIPPTRVSKIKDPYLIKEFFPAGLQAVAHDMIPSEHDDVKLSVEECPRGFIFVRTAKEISYLKKLGFENFCTDNEDIFEVSDYKYSSVGCLKFFTTGGKEAPMSYALPAFFRDNYAAIKSCPGRAFYLARSRRRHFVGTLKRMGIIRGQSRWAKPAPTPKVDPPPVPCRQPKPVPDKSRAGASMTKTMVLDILRNNMSSISTVLKYLGVDDDLDNEARLIIDRRTENTSKKNTLQKAVLGCIGANGTYADVLHAHVIGRVFDAVRPEVQPIVAYVAIALTSSNLIVVSDSKGIRIKRK